jgi:putative glycosyltransferase (TIGR04348 family)
LKGLRITILTDATRDSKSGNRVTANRWRSLLNQLGHQAVVKNQFDQHEQLLLAIHARKSAAAVCQFAELRDPASQKIVVVLSGTDIYRDLQNSAEAQRAIELADLLVALESRAASRLSKSNREKVRIVYPSAKAIVAPQPLVRCFEVSVSGHLRPEKNPFMAAIATRMLASSSRIRVTHIGKALSDEMAQSALRQMQDNSRYRWVGGKAPRRARQIVARSRLFINSSFIESASNAVVEAIVNGVPVLASRIDGNVGVLGDDYPGLFDVARADQLASLLERAESDNQFLRTLKTRVLLLAKHLNTETEQRSWQAIIDELL